MTKQLKGKPQGDEQVLKKWHKSIYQFDEEYASGLAEQYTPWLKEKVISNAAKILDNSASYNILGIGSGTGYADQVLLNVIAEYLANNKKNSKNVPKIFYMVIEPDLEATEICKKTLQSIKGLDVEFVWQAVTMQEYFSLKATTKYNMIHFIHSLCEVTRCATVLPEVLKGNHLADDGILFAVLGDQEKNFGLNLSLKHCHIISEVKGEHGGHHNHCHGNSSHYRGHHNCDKEDCSHDNQDRVAAAAATHNECHCVHGSFGRKEMEFVSSGDAMKLKRAIEGCGWKTEMFTREIKQDVTSILSGSERGMSRLGYILEIKDIDKKLKKKDLDNIVKDIEETSKCENNHNNNQGQRERFVTSSNNILVVYK